MADINKDRKTKIQLLTKTKGSSANLDDVTLDRGEPLVDLNTETLIVGTGENDNKGKFTVGAGRNVFGDTNTSTTNTNATETTSTYLNHVVGNRVNSSQKFEISGGYFNTDSSGKLTIGINIPTWDSLTDKPNIYGPGSKTDVDRAIAQATLHKYDIKIYKELISNGNYSYTAYVYDGSNWAAMSGNYNAENIVLSENITVTQDVGYYKRAQTIEAGTSIQTLLTKMLFKESTDIVITDPSISLNISSTNLTGEVGSAIPSVNGNISFNSGSYQYGPTPTGVTVKSNGLTINRDETQLYKGANKSSFNDNLGNFTLGNSSYRYTVEANHTAGELAKYNTGEDSTRRISEGSVRTFKNISVTGYWPYIYAISTNADKSFDENAEIDRNPTIGGFTEETRSQNLGTFTTTKSFKKMFIFVPSGKAGPKTITNSDTGIKLAIDAKTTQVKISDYAGNIDNGLNYTLYTCTLASPTNNLTVNWRIE